MEKEINYAIPCKSNKKHDANIRKYFKEPLKSLNPFAIVVFSYFTYPQKSQLSH